MSPHTSWCHTFVWVMSHIWMSRVTHMKEPCPATFDADSTNTHMNKSCHKYKKAMSHTWRGCVIPVKKQFYTYEWVVSRIWRRHVTRMNESCHTYEYLMSHVWLRHVSHMDESCHTYEWVLSHMNESCHTSIRSFPAACAWYTGHLEVYTISWHRCIYSVMLYRICKKVWNLSFLYSCADL